jgi:putative peptide zinc metalloprotease protein
LLLISALTVTSAAFHEFGHAAAARYGGATPGAMGAGVYLAWPVFFTDVTDSYRLDRRGRLRTDLGGVYFNVLFVLAVAAAYHLTGYRPLTVFVLLGQFETLYQFLPFVRLDGYYVVSDLIGVPNLFAYMGPVLVKLTRRAGPQTRRRADAKLANLKPWARRLITVWVCLTVPILLVNVVVLAVFAPRMAGATWASTHNQLHEIAAAHTHGSIIGVLNGAISILLLALPIAGTAYIIARLTARLGRGARHCWRVHPLPTAIGTTLLIAILALHATLVAPEAFTGARKQIELAYSGQPPFHQATPAVTPAPPTNTLTPADTSSPAGGPEPATRPTMAPVPAHITPPGEPTTALAPVPPTPGLEPSAPTQAVPAPAQPPAEGTDTAATWTVQPGDDLWSIAQQVQARMLGRPPTDDETSSYWAQLVDANRATVATPDLLHAGQVLTIPGLLSASPEVRPR